MATDDLNPYRTPKADVSRPENSTKIVLPAKIQGQIMQGVVTGIVLTLFAAWQTAMSLGNSHINPYSLTYTLVVGGLTFGLYKRNRVCAILLLGMYVGDRLLGLIGGIPPASLILPVLFAWLFLRGTIGTFAAHTLQQQADMTQAVPQSKPDATLN